MNCPGYRVTYFLYRRCYGGRRGSKELLFVRLPSLDDRSVRVLVRLIHSKHPFWSIGPIRIELGT
jgi:hypothetical protein